MYIQCNDNIYIINKYIVYVYKLNNKILISENGYFVAKLEIPVLHAAPAVHDISVLNLTTI